MTYQKILVTYFSRSGNCRRVAEEIARQLNCDLQGVHSLTDYPLGFWGFQKALIDTAINRNISIQVGKKDLRDYDLVIVGSPIWFGRVAQPIKIFLEKYKDSFKNIAFFCTQDGSAGSDKLFKQMGNLSGKKPVVTLKITSQEIRNETFQKKVAQFVELFKPIPKKSTRRPSTEAHPPLS